MYTSQNLKQVEIKTRWDEISLTVIGIFALARRLKELGITYINYETSEDDVKEAMKKEINGPGKLLGYWTMNQKPRTEYSIHIPYHIVHNMMHEVHQKDIAARQVNKNI